jgi:hypothetical protein
MKFCTNSKTHNNLNIGYDNKTILFYSVVSYFQLHNSFKGTYLCCHVYVWNDVFVDIWWSCEHDCLLSQIHKFCLWCHFCTGDIWQVLVIGSEVGCIFWIHIALAAWHVKDCVLRRVLTLIYKLQAILRVMSDPQSTFTCFQLSYSYLVWGINVLSFC